MQDYLIGNQKLKSLYTTSQTTISDNMSKLEKYFNDKDSENFDQIKDIILSDLNDFDTNQKELLATIQAAQDTKLSSKTLDLENLIK